MRIAYGVHGFGRGHAMRALAVLPELVQRHDVLILAGGDAHRALWPEFPAVRIPVLSYDHNRRGRISPLRTARHNFPLFSDLLLRGTTSGMVRELLEEFEPDVVLSDSEIWTHRLAERMRIPRITFDHYGLLVYCRPGMPRIDRLKCWGSGLVYRAMFGRPDRAIVSGFFEAPPRREGVCCVGPVIRKEVRQTQPTRGDHLLAYFSKGEHEYTPNIDRALAQLDCPVRVYGPPRRGTHGNVEFKPLANLPFIEDLASCRAVLATAGNQLCGEVIHFGKPLLALPMNCVEQRLNAYQVQRMGVGMYAKRDQVNADLLRAFLDREDEFVKNARTHGRDGAAEALEAIERFGRELVGKPAGASAKEGHDVRALT